MLSFLVRFVSRPLLLDLTVGTQGYTAPEVLKGQHYGTAADVFSFAVVMSEVLTQRPAYSESSSKNGQS